MQVEISTLLLFRFHKISSLKELMLNVLSSSPKRRIFINWLLLSINQIAQF